METPPAPAPNPFVDLPLPDYVITWDAGAYRPKMLPAVYEARIDPAHIFAVPGDDEGSDLYIVAHRCTQCARVRQTCSRGYPTCKRCAEKELNCHPTEEGWVEVPVPRKKASLRQEVQALRKSLPDAPYYREHSKSVAKTMTVPAAGESSSAHRKAIRASAGQESVSPKQKGRRGSGGGGKQSGVKRGGRKALVSPEQSDSEADETSPESLLPKPAETTNIPSPAPASTPSAAPQNIVTTRPLSVTYVGTDKASNESQSSSPSQDIVPPPNTVQNPDDNAANTATNSTPELGVSSRPTLPASVSSPPPVPASTKEVPDPAISTSSGASETTSASTSQPGSSSSTSTRAINPIPVASGGPTSSSRLSIRVPPRVGVVPYGGVSAQRAAEQFLGISKPSSTSKARPPAVATLIAAAPPAPRPASNNASPAVQTATTAAASHVAISASSNVAAPTRNGSSLTPPTPSISAPPAAVSAPVRTEESSQPLNEKGSTTSESQDDSSCSFRLSATAWDRPTCAAASTPAQESNASDADSDTSTDEPLSSRKRSLSTAQTSASASISASASVSASTPRSAYETAKAARETAKAARKRKRVSESHEDPARKLTPWWTHAPLQWYGTYQHGVAGPSNGMMPVAIPIMPPPMHTLPPRPPPPPAEPFLSPLRPPLPSIQQRAERLAQTQQAPADTQSEATASTPAQESAWDSEEEVEQYLRRTRRKKSSSHSSSSRATAQEQPPLTFVPRQKILADSTAVMVDNVLFHLPKSRLVQNSEFFARQLAKDRERDKDREANGTDDEEPTVDRCPVVKVSGVCAEDFEDLLGVCDNLGSFMEKQPPFKTLAAVFCAARTLRFGQIDALATYKLTNMWPGDLHKLSPLRTPHAAETVVLARMYDLPAVLKRAFYELLRSEGFAQQSVVGPSSNTPTDSPSTEVTLDGSRLVGKAKLSHADLVRLITTREKLSLAWTLLVGTPPSSASLPCMLQHTTGPNALYSTNAARERCAAATRNSAAIWAEWVLDSGLFETWMYDPVCGLERLSVLDWESSGYCSSCVMSRRQLWSRKREEIWENLDVWLGL